MRKTQFGQTGLEVSVMGLGCGGPSRLGAATGQPRSTSIEVVHAALDEGINFFDTAESYGTEDIVGEALEGVPRDEVVISSKTGSFRDKHGPADLRRSLEESLRKLRTDHIDIYNFHGAQLHDLPHIEAVMLPEMIRFRDEGKIRFIGVTEAFERDHTHEMLKKALHHLPLDSVMVGFNILNQTARQAVFPETRTRKVGTQIMFAVRRAFSNPDRMREVLQELAEKGEIDPVVAADPEPLSFVRRSGAVTSLTEAAYRFCLHEPGCDVILTGTGNPEHLRENVECADMEPLPTDLTLRLQALFAEVRSATAG